MKLGKSSSNNPIIQEISVDVFNQREAVTANLLYFELYIVIYQQIITYNIGINGVGI